MSKLLKMLYKHSASKTNKDLHTNNAPHLDDSLVVILIILVCFKDP